MSKFIENLKKARKMKGINQEDLAKSLKVSQASISQFESGERVPTESCLKGMAEILEVTVEELVGGDGTVIGQNRLIQKIRGLSLESIEQLSEQADYLRYREGKSCD